MLAYSHIISNIFEAYLLQYKLLLRMFVILGVAKHIL